MIQDYENKNLEIAEKLKIGVQGIGIVILFSYMFYRSYIAFILLSPILWFYYKQKKKEYAQKRIVQLGFQFQELMYSALTGLQAGYSIENAFLNAYGDMVALFGENSYIAKELVNMRRCLYTNQNLEDVLEDFAKRSHNGDIQDFAEVFRVAKRSGGNLPAMMEATVEVIHTRMEVSRKISTIISAKKLEQSIMNLVPFGILLYINATSPGFFDSLYHNLSGVAIMTVLMAIYLVAYVMAEKIIQINM